MELEQALLPPPTPQTPPEIDRRGGIQMCASPPPCSPQKSDLYQDQQLDSCGLETDCGTVNCVQQNQDVDPQDVPVSGLTPNHGSENDNMAEKYQEKCFELEVMGNKCEMLTKKYLEECETKYNTLMKKFTDECAEKEVVRNELAGATKKCIEDCGPKYERLMKKYTEECLERKRLYNELVEMKGNIRVFCRCRPLGREEISKGSSNVFEFDASQETELHITSGDSSKKQFKFDHVFGPQASQESVFAETLPIIKSVLDGFNACIFAYGQTGSGKTFTMEGTDENRGVNYRALEELFKISNERSPTIRYNFFVSMLEVYNERIRDLLIDSSQQGKKLEIKQVAEGTLEVPGLEEAQAYNTNDVWELLRTGRQNRSVGSTNANELSSRSHCLLRVTVKGENLMNGQKNRSHLWLVDLAGSERVGKIEVEGERLKESQFINKSLSALGDVISALATKNSHIPYRNSKLTHLLQSSLGGDCKTLMFVQISPSSADLGETICSLNFATRVRGIEQGPARKQADPAESFKYKQLAEKLRIEERENARLNESLQLMHLKFMSRENVFKTLQEKIKDLENQLADERRARHQQETKDATTTKFQRPPLPPIKERPPLCKITNNVPSLPRRNSITTMPSFVRDKENFAMTTKTTVGKAPLKAQRILVTPVSRPVGLVPRRRVSIASLPSYSQKPTVFSREALNNPQQSYSNRDGYIPQSRQPSRRSIMSFSSSVVPMTPVTSTPDRHNRTSSFITNCYSSSKYSSPQQKGHQRLWKSKIPTAAASPRRRLRLVSTPGSGEQKYSTPGKICFSVQKRLVIGSPAPLQLQRPAMLQGVNATNQPLTGKEILQKYGRARRVLCKSSKDRRASVA